MLPAQALVASSVLLAPFSLSLLFGLPGSPPIELVREAAAGEERMTLPDGRVVVSSTVPGPDGQPVRDGNLRVFPAGSEEWLVSGTFEQGVREGTWRYRYGSGETAATGKFKAGEQKGRWKFYWPDGSVAATGLFKGGEPSGKWDFNDPLDPESKGRSVAITKVSGVSAVDGSTYSGFLADGGLIGWWSIVRPDGSLLFEGAFNQFGALRANSFRHAGGVQDASFFGELGDAPHPHDFLFRTLDEYGDVVGQSAAEVVDVPAGVASLAALWKSDADFAGATPLKLVPAPADAKVIRYPAGFLARSLDPRPTEEVRFELAGAVKALASVDWTDVNAARPALAAVQGIVAPALGYPDLGFEFSSSTAAPDRNGLAVLRAHSLLTIKRHDQDFWLIDAAVETTAPGEGLPLMQVSRIDPRNWLSDKDRKTLAKAQGKPSKSASRKKSRRIKKKGGDQSAGMAEAIEAGLQWLLGAQQPDGRWRAGDIEWNGPRPPQPHEESVGHDVGVTSLAVLALARDPATPGNPERLNAVRRGLRYILGSRNQSPGLLIKSLHFKDEKGLERSTYTFGWIYDHSAAVQALAASRSVVQSIRVELGLKDAIAVLLRARNPYGGWRYAIPADGDSDFSATFWVMRALLAGQAAGHPIDGELVASMIEFADTLTSELGRTGYVEAGSMSARVPGANQKGYPANACETLTAEAVALRKWLGQGNDGIVQAGADLMARCLPEWSEDGAKVDYCYWLAGTEAMVQVGGSVEEAWRRALVPTLLDRQVARSTDNGSWDPIGAWGFAGGRTYATASAVMALQILAQGGD